MSESVAVPEEPQWCGSIVRLGVKAWYRIPLFDQPAKPWLLPGHGYRASWEELAELGPLTVESTGARVEP